MLPLDQPLYPIADEIRGEFIRTYVFRQYGNKTRVYPYYYPYNPRTAQQQVGRNLFAEAVINWRALDAEGRRPYNELSRWENQSGYNRYIGQYLRANYFTIE